MAGVISMAAEIGTMGQILIDSAVLAIISGSLIYVYGVKPYTIGRSEQLKEIVETRNQLKSANIELIIILSHRNSGIYQCCTSNVNLAAKNSLQIIKNKICKLFRNTYGLNLQCAFRS